VRPGKFSFRGYRISGPQFRGIDALADGVLDPLIDRRSIAVISQTVGGAGVAIPSRPSGKTGWESNVASWSKLIERSLSLSR